MDVDDLIASGQSSGQTFRFDFPRPDETKNDSVAISTVEYVQRKRKSSGHSSFMKITPHIDEAYLRATKDDVSTINIGSHAIKYIASPSVAAKFASTKPGCQFTDFGGNSDLIPGVYEGGFKVWECALDLAKYLHSNECFKNRPNVLELGCGAGIPGLVAYLSGCNVTFQDYNSEVLEFSTIPNIHINTPSDCTDTISERCTFLCGDWDDIRMELYGKETSSSTKYDMIITSETIYEKSNHVYLLNLMKCSLNPNGTIYLAAKSYYFGVGGTIDDFEALVKMDATFSTSEVYANLDGVERKIIEMKFRKCENG